MLVNGYEPLPTRIDELGEQAEEYLTQIPVDLPYEDMRANMAYYNSWCLYCECIELINVLRGEVGLKPIPMGES